VVQFENLVHLHQKKFHAKAQSREASAQGDEAFDLLALFLAPLRLCVRLPFPSLRLKLNHYPTALFVDTAAGINVSSAALR
jgi:hypothetical protein